MDVFPDIVRLALEDLAAGLKEREIGFECTDEAVQRLAEKSYSAEYGARNVRRVVQSEIEDRAVRILCETFEIPQSVSVSVADGEIHVSLSLK